MVESLNLCGTCNKPIEAVKFRMHELQCAKLNYKCEQCGDVVEKTEKTNHDATAHVKVIYQKCRFC